MSFDLETAEITSLAPLANSFAVDAVEDELRALFIHLFKSKLGEDAFDANVAGMMHLGTYELVRKAVNFDGLTLTGWQGAEEATRYVYRAWKSRNNQGRGLHFLRTYLQMLFPNAYGLTQLWHPHDQTYPSALSETEGDGMYLTSRVQVFVDAQDVAGSEVAKARKSIHSVLPARFVPDIGVIATGVANIAMPSFFSVSTVFTLSGDLSEIPLKGTVAIDHAGVFAGTSLLDSSGALTIN